MSSTKGIKTVDDAFAWFEKNIARVDDQDNQDAKEVWPDIVKAVEKKLPVERHFLSGSYGRKVQAIKLKDIDIIVEVHDADGAYRASAKDTLLEVQHALRDCELVRQARPPSVRAAKALLHDYEFHVDVVPAIDDGGDGLLLPCNLEHDNINKWTREYPEQQRDACKDKNDETNGLYRPATRVVRAYNQRYETAKVLRSYHAESLLYHAIGDAKTLQKAFIAFLDHAYDALAPGRLTATPGAPAGRYVDDRLEPEERERTREKIGKARDRAHKAEEMDDPGEAMEEWAKVFGDKFPTPSTHPDIVEAALRSGTAVASTSTIRARRTQDDRDLIHNRSWRRS